jgi:hypothetical protein
VIPEPLPAHAVPMPTTTKEGGRPTYLVPFLGDGTDGVLLTVIYIAEYPRDVNDACAYCHGDPCALRAGPDTLIGAYFGRNSRATTCPCCEGRPT